jgi:predicted transcriptional regulator with HTH domain
MNHWVMDYETLKNCFVGVFKHYKANTYKTFVIHKLQDDSVEFIKFLKENIKNNEYHISFNGIGFDSQVTHNILKYHKEWKDMDPEGITEEIYGYAQEAIRRSNNREFSEFPEWNMKINQIDVFKLNHWDNMAKRSSLKWIEYTMDWDNILDMPIHHEADINTQEELNTIVEYCINDVDATHEIYNRSKDLIALRINLTKEYNINLMNASEPRISKELFSYYLSKELNIEKRELKRLRTFRKSIKLEKIILPYVDFITPEFNTLLERFQSVELDPQNIKGSFKHAVVYQGVKTHFGLGGAHGANQPGVYEADDDNIIMSSDVTSFYPMLAIKNGWSPAHLPSKEFCTLYEWFFTERKKVPKSNPMNYVYKIILNSTYGLSNDKNSFLYDPEFTMRITINGQLTLMMLYEMIMEAIPNAVPLLQNTDGIETIIPKQYKQKYMEICKKWEKITNFNLEHDQYKKLILADVNNYIAINMEDKAKCKGRFESNNLALHKNKSKLVIPKAIFEYFVNDVLPEDYLKTNKNILDYCIGSKTNSGWQVVADSLKDGIYKQENLQKINRYFISDTGVKLIKRNKNDGREIQLEAGKWIQTVFNQIEEKQWSEYNVDQKYYLQAIEKEINNILNTNFNQLSLF